MSRAATIAAIERYFDSGGFMTDLSRRVAIPTESQNPERADELRSYNPDLSYRGFAARSWPILRAKAGRFWLPSGSKIPPCQRC